MTEAGIQNIHHHSPQSSSSLPSSAWSSSLSSSSPGSADVTDVGIQNLVFPLSIQKAGRVNLVNTRARWVILLWCKDIFIYGDHRHDDDEGNVDDASQDEPDGKAVALRDGSGNRRRRHWLHHSPPVLPKVDKGGSLSFDFDTTLLKVDKGRSLSFDSHHFDQGGGRLEHESIGDAIYTLNKKLKVNNIVLKGRKLLLLLCMNVFSPFVQTLIYKVVSRQIAGRQTWHANQPSNKTFPLSSNFF